LRGRKGIVAMKSPTVVIAVTTFVCLSPAVAFAGDRERHPLIGEPPAPIHVRPPSAMPGPATQAVWMTRQKEELVASLVGVKVYDTDEVQIGDVTAVLFTSDGGVDTLLIRMGESSAIAGQDVALPFDLVTTATRSDGTTMIVVDTDGEEIAGAARFVDVEKVPPTPR
jgi:sporulation protein YlmC with PRC-barrel domain